MTPYESIRDAIFQHQTSETSRSAPETAPLIDGEAATHIVATLSSRAASHPQKLHWQSSIIDLMELLGLDACVANRRLLAQELSYSGDETDLAGMDRWLHRAVMSNLAGKGNPGPI
jgi:hypothetical protein